MLKTIPENLHRTGYDHEEEYFFRMNMELIERNRRILNEQRRIRERTQSGKSYWMKCPCCGSDLKAAEVLGLRGDVCEHCGGVYFDRGELTHLAETHEAHSFKEAIKRILSEATKPLPSGIGQFPV